MAVQERFVFSSVDIWNPATMKFPPVEHKKYSTEFCCNTISLECRRIISNVVAAEDGSYLGYYADLSFALHDSHRDLWEWETNDGKWPKRFARWFRDNYNRKLSNDILGKLGDIAVRSIGDKEYIWDVDYQIDWHAGDFGDDYSCFWTTNSGAKNMLRDNGGFALRLWDPNNIYSGIARCWVFELHEGLHIVWNGYGVGTWEIARLAAIIVGGIAEKIPLMNNGDANGTLYINGSEGGIGYLVGTQEAIDDRKERRKHPEYVDLKWEDDDEYRVRCTNCGSMVDEDCAYYIGDDTLCESCGADNTDCCQQCGERIYTDDMMCVNDDWYCNYCFDRYFAACDSCGEADEQHRMHERDNEMLCADCAADFDREKAEKEAQEQAEREEAEKHEGTPIL